MGKAATKNELKSTYESIQKLYDCAEDIISAIEAVGGPEAEAALNAAEPVIEQLESTAEILSETFIIYGETGQKMSAHNRKRAENAIQKLYHSLSVFCAQIGGAMLGLQTAITELSGDIRGQIIELQQKMKRKFGSRAEKLFAIMLWIGDYMKKLAHQLEKAGTGLIAALAIPGMEIPAPVTLTGRNTNLRPTENTRGWGV